MEISVLRAKVATSGDLTVWRSKCFMFCFFPSLLFLVISSTLKQTKFISASPENWWLWKIKIETDYLVWSALVFLKTIEEHLKALWLSNYSDMEPENVVSTNTTMHISSSAKKEERWESMPQKDFDSQWLISEHLHQMLLVKQVLSLVKTVQIWDQQVEAHVPRVHGMYP